MRSHRLRRAAGSGVVSGPAAGIMWKGSRVSFISQVEVEDAPAASVTVKPVDQLRGVFGNFPDGLGAFDQMYERMVGKGRLDQSLRFAILGSAARWRDDQFISGLMFQLALDAGLESAALESLIADAEQGQASEANAALLAFCKKATENAFKMVDGDIETLRAHGWTNGQIVEATSMVSLSGYMTVMAAGGGFLQQPGLKAEPWR